MGMNLSTSEREELRRLQRNLCGSSDYARVTCILMLDSGYSPSAISDCLGIDTSTVYRYRSAYLHGDAAELLENRHRGYWGGGLTAVSLQPFAMSYVHMCIPTPRALPVG